MRTGTGPTNLRNLRDQDSARSREEGSWAHPGLCSASPGPERDHAPDQRTPLSPVVRGVPAAAEALLGTALLGTRVFVCHGRAEDRRDDRSVSGTALRAESLGQLSHGGLTTGLGPVSGLSVHMTNPPALAGGCSVISIGIIGDEEL